MAEKTALLPATAPTQRDLGLTGPEFRGNSANKPANKAKIEAATEAFNQKTKDAFYAPEADDRKKIIGAIDSMKNDGASPSDSAIASGEKALRARVEKIPEKDQRDVRKSNAALDRETESLAVEMFARKAAGQKVDAAFDEIKGQDSAKAKVDAAVEVMNKLPDPVKKEMGKDKELLAKVLETAAKVPDNKALKDLVEAAKTVDTPEKAAAAVKALKEALEKTAPKKEGGGKKLEGFGALVNPTKFPNIEGTQVASAPSGPQPASSALPPKIESGIV